MKVNNTSEKFKAARSSGRIGKKKRSSFNATLSTNYELMLRLYLISKEQRLSKQALKYVKLTQNKKVDTTKTHSSVWNNIVQVVHKANQLINALNHTEIEIATK
jgi:hypothetical protein